jgi:hypothetical protein
VKHLPEKSAGGEQRRYERTNLEVAFRLVPRDRPNDSVEGHTIDVSANGAGVKFSRGRGGKIDALLEQLVEERSEIEIHLRLPEGSVSASGTLMWWGLLGEEEGYTLRGGVLLPRGWSARDWDLIQKIIKAS